MLGPGFFRAAAEPPGEKLRPDPEFHNLGFEAGDALVRWKVDGEDYTASVVSDEKHSGRRSVRFVCDPQAGKNYGIVYNYVSAGPARGKRLRFFAYLKTAGITRGWAGLWMRADDRSGPLAYADMAQRGVTGTTAWTRYEVAIDVPEDAEGIRFGAILRGNGTLWMDTVTFELAAPAGPSTIAVRGLVRDPAGRPVAGAHVALVGALARHATAHAKSGEDGRFVITAPPGVYALTATAPGFAAAFRKGFPFAAGKTPPEQALALGEAGVTVSGHLRDEAGRPLAGVLVYASPFGFSKGDLFYTTTEATGRYELGLPRDAYSVRISSDEYRAMPRRAVGGKTLDLVAIRRRPAPESVVDWIRGTAIPLKTAIPGADLADLVPLGEVVGEARVVGVGEATHGTREFFQLKHRMFEFLVEKMGFTVFAVEAGWAESLAINDYVLGGEGDAAELLRGLHIWPVRIEELLEIIEWMRRYNADPAHRRKLKFYGLDMQFTPAAAAAATAYLQKVDPEIAESFAILVEPMRELRAAGRFAALDDQGKARLIIGLEAAATLFDVERQRWIERTGQRPWAVGRHHVVMLMSAVALFQDPDAGFARRDQWMAANVEWILNHEPPGTRMLISAHNGHLTREERVNFRPLGWHLDRVLGDDYVVFGCVFNQGAFQAFDQARMGVARRVRQITVGPAPADYLGAALARAGVPILALDLRRPAPQAVTAWFRSRQPMRSVGAVATGVESMTQIPILSASFDALLFVDTTTRTRPLGQAPPAEGADPDSPRPQSVP